MLSIFRSRYPTGRLISELATVHNGKYIVRTLVQVNGENIGSGLAAAETVELAEAKARKRAIENLELDSTTSVSVSQSPKAVSSVAPPPPRATAGQPASQKLTEVAATRDVVKNQTQTQTKSKTQTKTQVDKERPTATPEERPPIASTATKEPVTIPNESDRFDSDDWLNSSSSSSSEFEAKPLGGSGELIDSLSEIGSDRSTAQKDSIAAVVASGMESQTPSTAVTAAFIPLDLSNTTATIDVLLNNLNWSKERERDYLELTYGEKLRSLLNEEKLLDFQQYLEILAKVTAKIKALGWKPKQEKDYLKNHQSGKTREELNANELTEFLEYLEIFDKITDKIKELGWTNEQGKDYLQETYGVVGRTRLSLEQLQDFLLYLESL